MNDTLDKPVGTPSTASQIGDTVERVPTTAIKWTAHPLVDLDPAYRRLTDEEFDLLTPAEAEEYVKAREERIRAAKVDPFRYCFDLPHWHLLWHYLLQYWELFNFGGNDSAKTTFIGRTINKILFRQMEIPGAMEGPPQICCIAQNQTMSKRVQQRKTYEFLPVELRKTNDSGAPKKRTATQKLSYSDDGGFTNGSFTVANPRGASVLYRNVTQFERNELSLEGDGFHLVPIDESCPLALLDVVRFRAAKKRGRIPYCFTPVKGFDAVCANVLRGARVIAYLPMQWDWALNSTGANRGNRDRKTEFTNTETNQPDTSAAKVEAGTSSEGPDRDGNKPLMRNRTAEDVPSPIGNAAADTFQGTYRADGQFVPKGAESIAQFLTGGINPEIQFPELSLAKAYVKGVPAGHMPVVLKPLNPKAIVVFTWSHWNPFAPRSDFNKFLPAIADRCVGRGERIALMRLFGYTEELAGAILSNFKPDYFPRGHLIRHEELLELLRVTPHNLRHGVDPATARSWFQGWKAVLKEGLDDRPMQYLVWESPSKTEGEWVTPDGEIGDGQRIYGGKDVDFWKTYIRETEAMLQAAIKGQTAEVSEGKFNPDPILRAGDSRGFAAQTGEGTKYLELFYRDDAAKDPRLAPMIFRPAKVMSTVWQDVHDAGKLIDLLACDWDKPIDATNHPHLLISDACQNFIQCALNWDGKKTTLEGRPVNSPFADGVDMARVLFDQEIPFIDPNQSSINGGGAW